MKYTLFFFVLMVLFSCRNEADRSRSTIDLSGNWQFSIDTGDIGTAMKWYLHDLPDSVILPGTTDLNKKGYLNHDTTTMHLNRIYKYEGAAWYRKKISIPESFHGKHIWLFLERTKSSTVWIDDKVVGKSRILQSPQTFDLTGLATPGDHFITVRIDNSLKLTPYGNVHIYSDDTQTNWNGIIGSIKLFSSSRTYINNIRVTPDKDSNRVAVQLSIVNDLKINQVGIELYVDEIINGKTRHLPTRKFKVSCDTVINLRYDPGKKMQLWDDYKQPLYALTAVISDGNMKDDYTVHFGMRHFAASGTRFTINGRPVFLRGKHDACVFPLTGCPPMDVEEWEKVFKIAKSYGINHYRFHSWCPPDAAFTAADRTGIFIQAELPFWGGLDSDSIAEMEISEGIEMLKNYANHPSFVLFSMGNEIWSGQEKVDKNIKGLKAFDNRPLYAMGSNNGIGYVGPSAVSDFFVAARTPYSHDTTLTHTRLTHAFADSKDGGILNTQYPSTMVNFNFAVSQINVPLISHEIGQYQVYPDYSEIAKYTGVLKPWNLEVFRKRLEKSGMADQNADFQKASGAWAAICYKAEIEAALRTEGLAGFQLLDLQDFPGQGTALVGILDAFMDDKGIISQDDWLHSCNDVVVLLEFPKFCWKNNEVFISGISVVNYSQQSFFDHVNWEIINAGGKVLANGAIANMEFKQGIKTKAGQISYPLASIAGSEALKIRVWLNKSGYANHYPVWVYPDTGLSGKSNVVVVRTLDMTTQSLLKIGEKVLYFPMPNHEIQNSTGGLFPPEFWNYGMFKGISEWVHKPVSPGTLGILTNPDHPVFSQFPTEFHTNWQWFSIIKAATPLILDETAADYRPVVQVIDNLERNHKLGLIFEFKYGKGKLLVCMSALPEISDKPEAVQLYKSLLAYMNSPSFNPEYEADEALLQVLFK